LVVGPTAEAGKTAPAVERPEGPTVGVGVGSSLEPWLTPEAAMAVHIDRGGLRLRLTDRLTVAPGFVHSRWERSADEGGLGDRSLALKQQELQASVRWVAGSRGPMDLVLLGGGDLGRSVTSVEDSSARPGRSGQSWLGLRTGLGIEAFVRPQWSVGLDAEMQVFNADRSETPARSERSSTLRLGWAPGVSASTYLYF